MLYLHDKIEIEHLQHTRFLKSQLKMDHRPKCKGNIRATHRRKQRSKSLRPWGKLWFRVQFGISSKC